MAELREDQLILLNSLMYVTGDFAPGTTMEQLIRDLEENKVSENFVNDKGLAKSEVEELLRTIKSDPDLMELKVYDSIDGEIRGACFTNSNDEAVIAFRGTGGTHVAWDDNFQGGYLADTDMQEQALEFARKCAQEYDDITVTGHSKGGNMAQYITVLMGDKVDRCVSFDGQGFSEEFLEKYEDKVALNQDKIRSVCSYNDYVNILLTPIAGEIVYLDNENSTFPGGHYIYDLYTNPNNQVNENGEYTTVRSQDPLVWLLKEKLEEVVQKLDNTGSPALEFLVYSALGMLFGKLLGGDLDWDGIEDIIWENVRDFIEYYNGKESGRERDESFHILADTRAIEEYGKALSSAAVQVEDLRSRIQGIKKQVSDNIIDGVAIGLPLEVVLFRLNQECEKLQKLANFLTQASRQYESAETQAKAITGDHS